MFEKEAEEIANKRCHEIMCFGHCSFSSPKHHRCGEWHREYNCAKDGAEFGYNKANEDVKHDLMMKLKDEGIVKVLKDSIFCNKKLSSQEQQELCAWVECAIDFGENLDECAKELEEANKANEWHYVKSEEDLPKDNSEYLLLLEHGIRVFGYYNGKWGESWKGDLSWQEVKAYFFVPVPELKESE